MNNGAGCASLIAVDAVVDEWWRLVYPPRPLKLSRWQAEAFILCQRLPRYGSSLPP
ncbi:hypothetical protein KCP76_21245 [Salmonella enterica subsp. enterica serovar Weltevreden]|nr:hypothetical protein KCP76_21245 [Salmonella enterica subsp. enterica serovar Weltevreden]